jgi:hypothetical protein
VAEAAGAELAVIGTALAEAFSGAGLARPCPSGQLGIALSCLHGNHPWLRRHVRHRLARHQNW